MSLKITTLALLGILMFIKASNGNDCTQEWTKTDIGYLKFYLAKKTFKDAQEDCRRCGAEIVKGVNDEDTNKIVSSMIRTTPFIWLGLERNPIGDLLWQSEKRREEINTAEQCAVMTRDGKRKDAFCDFSASYVCAKKDVCPDGWSSNGQNECLKALEGSLPQHTAEEKCQKNGASLVEIKNQETQDLANKLAKEAGIESYWIGAKRRTGYDEFYWMNDPKKTPLKRSWTNWSAGEPTNAGPKGENCVQVGKNGQWFDIRCSQRMSCICSKKA